MTSLEERFFAKVIPEPNTGCWLWLGALGKQEGRYGTFFYKGRTTLAHRVSMEISGRNIPSGMQVDHKCRNRTCVNPDHLRVCTPSENTLANGSKSLPKLNADKTNCPKGHEYAGDNLGIRPNGNRRCRACARERARRRRARGGA